MNNYCIYRHLKLNGDVFYIGIGTKHRPYSKHNRNNYWKNIVNKYDYEVEILKNDLTHEEAIQLEKILIDYYGRRDLGTGCLCNLTDGGEGTQGIKKSFPEHLKPIIAERMKGNKHLLGHVHSEETKNKISNSLKGRIFSEETRSKISKALKGIKRKPYSRSEESKIEARNRDMLLINRNVTIYLDLETGIYYTAKELITLLNLSKFKIYNTFKSNRFIKT